jgi:putative Mn2+ efflux pump MntP
VPSWTWTLTALAGALAMDATAAAACRGLAAKRARLSEGLAIALTFGIFQSAMTLGGWALGALVGPWFRAWDHWIAFALLLLVGGKMLHEAYTAAGEESEPRALTTLTLISLAFATSVDALAAGVTLPTLGVPIVASIVAIGVVTSVLSGAGFAAGRRLGATIGPRLDMLGGVVRIALGAKILIEHLSAA